MNKLVKLNAFVCWINVYFINMKYEATLIVLNSLIKAWSILVDSTYIY